VTVRAGDVDLQNVEYWIRPDPIVDRDGPITDAICAFMAERVSRSLAGRVAVGEAGGAHPTPTDAAVSVVLSTRAPLVDCDLLEHMARMAIAHARNVECSGAVPGTAPL